MKFKFVNGDSLNICKLEYEQVVVSEGQNHLQKKTKRQDCDDLGLQQRIEGTQRSELGMKEGSPSSDVTVKVMRDHGYLVDVRCRGSASSRVEFDYNCIFPDVKSSHILIKSLENLVLWICAIIMLFLSTV